MTFVNEINKGRFRQIILLLLVFHLFWLIFYVLSEATFLKPERLHYYFKQSVINTIGFTAFCAAAYWLFPVFVAKNKWRWFTMIGLVIIIGLGYAAFKLQDWDIKQPDFLGQTEKPALVPAQKKTMPQYPLKQTIGAPVRAMLNILVYVMLGLGYAYMKDWFVKDRRTRILEKEKLQAELTLLRYQLNPHFLFNTINDIYYLAIIQSDKTADAILKVSDLLRYVLNEKEEQVALEKEIDYLKEFIKLQQFRFPDQVVEVQMNISEDISNCQIAPMLLISFAENAFKHGEPGTQELPVRVCLAVDQKQLLYTVSNIINGNKRKDSSTGIGLNNLKRRLSLLYPHRHEIILNEENGCFTAHLKIEFL